MLCSASGTGLFVTVTTNTGEPWVSTATQCTSRHVINVSHCVLVTCAGWQITNKDLVRGIQTRVTCCKYMPSDRRQKFANPEGNADGGGETGCLRAVWCLKQIRFIPSHTRLHVFSVSSESLNWTALCCVWHSCVCLWTPSDLWKNWMKCETSLCLRGWGGGDTTSSVRNRKRAGWHYHSQL